MVETRDDWDQEIGTLIDPEAFAEVWVGLVNEQDEMDDVFARFLISHEEIVNITLFGKNNKEKYVEH